MFSDPITPLHVSFQDYHDVEIHSIDRIKIYVEEPTDVDGSVPDYERERLQQRGAAAPDSRVVPEEPPKLPLGCKSVGILLRIFIGQCLLGTWDTFRYGKVLFLRLLSSSTSPATLITSCGAKTLT